jgi:pyridoxamine 5'-phosphate oxidase family protein
MFTEREIDYMKSQRLARLATLNSADQPDVTPVGYEIVGGMIYVGGVTMAETRKYKNLRAGRNKVAIVADDMISWDPPKPRGIRVYGTAEVVERDGMYGPGAYIKITPTVSWSWNIEDEGGIGPDVALRKTSHG